MKEVEWTDIKGRKRKSLVRDSDPIEMAKYGVPRDPPDVDMIDWEAVKIDLHNALYDMGIVEWDDLVVKQNQIHSACISSLKRHVVTLYKGTRT